MLSFHQQTILYFSVNEVIDNISVRQFYNEYIKNNRETVIAGKVAALVRPSVRHINWYSLFVICNS